MVMKELLKKLENVIKESGHPCMRIKDYYDFHQKVRGMEDGYKGFIMTEEGEDFCMLYVDTIKMSIEAERKREKFVKQTMLISPDDKVYLKNSPEEYVKEFTKLTTFKFYLRASKMIDEYEKEMDAERYASFFTRLKKLFKRRERR